MTCVLYGACVTYRAPGSSINGLWLTLWDIVSDDTDTARPDTARPDTARPDTAGPVSGQNGT